MKFALPLAALLSFCVSAAGATGGKGNGAPSPASAMQSGVIVGGGSGGQAYMDPRKAPPLVADRKINEQDCTRPVSLSAGNLRCK